MTRPDAMLASLQKARLERMLEAQMTEPLGYGKHEATGRGSADSRNGHGSKRALTAKDEVPRDRSSTCEPQFVARRQTRLPAFDEEVISPQSRGLTLRDIRADLEQLCKVRVSPDLSSRVTDVVRERVKQWHQLPLEPLYAVLLCAAAPVRS